MEMKSRLPSSFFGDVMLALCVAVIFAVLNISSEYNGIENFDSSSVKGERFSLKSSSTILRPEILNDEDTTGGLWNRNKGTAVTDCSQWAVVTTGRAWSENQKPESIRRVLNLRHWCLVIVGDDADADADSSKLDDDGYVQLARENERVVYLSPSEQQTMLGSSGSNFKFARKNLGHLFAIGHGAKVVFDFDDTSVLKSLEDGSIPPPFFYSDKAGPAGNRFGFDRSVLLDFPSTTKKSTHSRLPYVSAEKDYRLKTFHRLVFNPYFHYWIDVVNAQSPGETPQFPWRTGFPYDELKEDALYHTSDIIDPGTATGDLPYSKIGVIQSLSTSTGDNDNDNDNDNDTGVSRLPLMVPPGLYSPYNSEATVHLYHAFWGLYLPFTVGTPAVDVWRSYITQRLMKDIGLCVLFKPPMTYNDNNYNSGGGQQQHEEQNLYDQSKRLLDFLDAWSSEAPTLKERILDLWQALHFNKFKFVGVEDVEAVREWLAALDAIGYEFPATVGGQQHPRPHPQPSIEGGQPYRALPFINKHVVAKGTIKDEDDKLVMKMILITKDEWPMLKSWVTYHGQLVGFEHLYIVDASTDVRCTSFLKYSRDVLGVNVIFSKANLNTVQNVFNEMANNFAGSADFALKVDTDEYLFVPDQGKLQAPSEPQPLLEAFAGYVSGFRTNNDHPIRQLQRKVAEATVSDRKYHELTNIRVRYKISTIPSRSVCQKDVYSPLEDFHLTLIEDASGYFRLYDKRLYDTANPFTPDTRGFINLGGHIMPDETFLSSEFGIIHYHFRCHEIEVVNCKIVLISHGYIEESDSDEDVRKSLEERLGLPPDHELCTRVYEISELNVFASFHKAVWLLKYLVCPEQTIAEYYPEGREQGTYTDLKDFFQNAENFFGLNAPS